jgi:hypothetical protein
MMILINTVFKKYKSIAKSVVQYIDSKLSHSYHDSSLQQKYVLFLSTVQKFDLNMTHAYTTVYEKSIRQVKMKF